MFGVRTQPAEAGGRASPYGCSRLAVAFLGTWVGGTVLPAPLTIAATTSTEIQAAAAQLLVDGSGNQPGSTAQSLVAIRAFLPAGIDHGAVSSAVLGASNGHRDAHVLRAEWQALGSHEEQRRPVLWRAALTSSIAVPRWENAGQGTETGPLASRQSERQPSDDLPTTSSTIGAASVKMVAHFDPSLPVREAARGAPADFAQQDLGAQPIALPDPSAPVLETRHSPLAPAREATAGLAPPPSGFNIFGSVAIRSQSKALSRLIGNTLVEAGVSMPGCGVDTSAVDCAEKRRIPATWRKLIGELKDLPAHTKLERTNREVNQRIRYVTDQALHGILDHWSTPHATMAEGAGDCEDFAILKMWLLAQAGIAAEDMAVIVVRAPHLRSEHAVLAVRLRGDEARDEALILDNLTESVRPARAAGYTPIFSANATGLWLHGFPARREIAGR